MAKMIFHRFHGRAVYRGRTEKLPTLFGKISKWLSDLGAAAFCKVANNDTTTAAGYVADARAVEKLGKEVDTLNSALKSKSVKNQRLPIFEAVIV